MFSLKNKKIIFEFSSISPLNENENGRLLPLKVSISEKANGAHSESKIQYAHQPSVYWWTLPL